MARYADLAQKMVAACPGMRVARATRVLARVFNDEFRALGLQSSQHGVLTFVALAGPQGAAIIRLTSHSSLIPQPPDKPVPLGPRAHEP